MDRWGMSNRRLRQAPHFKNHVSSNIMPIGRFPFAYSLQYPPGQCRSDGQTEGSKLTYREELSLQELKGRRIHSSG